MSRHVGVVTDPSYYEPYFIKQNDGTLKISMRICPKCDQPYETSRKTVHIEPHQWSIARSHDCPIEREYRTELARRIFK